MRVRRFAYLSVHDSIIVPARHQEETGGAIVGDPGAAAYWEAQADMRAPEGAHPPELKVGDPCPCCGNPIPPDWPGIRGLTLFKRLVEQYDVSPKDAELLVLKVADILAVAFGIARRWLH